MKSVGSWSELADYQGKSAADGLSADRREAYLANWSQLRINYGDNVEFQLREKFVRLCPETVGFLYSHFTPLRTRYSSGARPVLESHVHRITRYCKSDREKLLSIMRYVRDLHRRVDGKQLFFGGTEEELIKKGEWLCECLGRLMVSLCEIAGIPGRLVMHVVGGHITTELYVEGGWAYVDPRCGVYFEKDDGRIASLWDLCCEPHITMDQPQRVKADVATAWTWTQRSSIVRERYCHSNEINGFENYSLADAALYNYDWVTLSDAVENGLNEAALRYRKAIASVLGLPYEEPKREIVVSLSDGQRVRGQVLVAAKTCGFVIPPANLQLYLNGKAASLCPLREQFPSFDAATLWYWDTTQFRNGLFRVRVETANKKIEPVSKEISVEVDN